MLFVWNSFALFCLSFRLYSLCSVGFLGKDGDSTLIVLASVEVNDTVCKCIQCVILTLCNILSWEVLVATLANDDVACNNLLSTPDLDT